MVRRHKKRSRKYLGSRSWGAGNIKNRRGKGSKGGKGYAGSHKHKFTYIVKYEPEHFGKKGFTSLKKKMKIINLEEINKLILEGKVEKSGDKFLFNFEGKVLGSGEINFPVLIQARSFSKKVAEKVKKAGGEVNYLQSKQASGLPSVS